MDRVDKIIAYENDELSQEETVRLFQEMIDDESVWNLQGHYGRTARALIYNGYCRSTSCCYSQNGTRNSFGK